MWIKVLWFLFLGQNFCDIRLIRETKKPLLSMFRLLYCIYLWRYSVVFIMHRASTCRPSVPAGVLSTVVRIIWFHRPWRLSRVLQWSLGLASMLPPSCFNVEGSNSLKTIPCIERLWWRKQLTVSLKSIGMLIRRDHEYHYVKKTTLALVVHIIFHLLSQTYPPKTYRANKHNSVRHLPDLFTVEKHHIW